MTTALTLPDLVPIRFQRDPDVAAWLVATWRKGFGDGNALADTLCKPLDNAGLTFAGDVDELLRALRKGPLNPHGDMGEGLGWLRQGSWCAHLSEFGQSREAWLGSYGKVSEYEASGHGFEPDLSCAAYAAFVRGWEAANPPHPVPAPTPTGPFPVGSKVRLTPKFLTSTGQRGSYEARKVWTVQACLCGLCTTRKPDEPNIPRFVAINERRDSPKEIAEYAGDPDYQDKLRKYPYRHINTANLRRA